MNVYKRRAVSPIIATLLLIAITVAAGVIVYVFVSGLSSSLTKSGGSQVTEQISLNSYDFQNPGSLTVYLQNTGSGSVTISSFYLDGAPITPSTGGTCTASALAPTDTCKSAFTVTSVTAGESVAFKVVTSDGGLFVFNVVAGSVG